MRTSAAPGLLLALFCGCSANDAPVVQVPVSRILLVTLDTTRADRIGAYGHGRAHTPTLDRLAREGILFERALAPTPVTLPSHASILTGTYPTEHGIHDNGIYQLSDDATLLPEVLREHGFRTGAFVAAYVLDSRFGLDQGFEEYSAPVRPGMTSTAIVERRASLVVSDARRWLSELGPDERFFAWVHFFDPHAPYDAPDDWKERIQDPYDAEIAYADEQLGKLLSFLADRELDDGLLVAVTADHGEALGEHGERSHGMFLYQPTIRVPLLLSGPAVTGGGDRVADAVSTVDLAPTLLALAGLPPEAMPHARRRPLVTSAGLLAEGGEERTIYLETYLPYHWFQWRALRGVASGRHKLVEGRGHELYDFVADPDEARDLAGRKPDLTASLRARLEVFLQEHPSLDWGKERGVSSEETELLAALGYVTGSSRGDPFAASLPDARDRVEDSYLFDDALRLIGEHDALRTEREKSPTSWQKAELRQEEREKLLEARAKLREILAGHPENSKAAEQLGFVESELGNPEVGIPLMEQAIRRNPTGASRYNLAWALYRTGRIEESIQQMERVVRAEPWLTDPYQWLGWVNREAGNEAVAAWWFTELERLARPGSLQAQVAASQLEQLRPILREAGKEPEAPSGLPVEEVRANQGNR